MSSETPVRVINQLLAGLPTRALRDILSDCKMVDLNIGETLCQPNELIRYVYFPLTGYIAQVTSIEGHPPLEMSLIGNEGMLGITLLLGVNYVPERAVVRGSGSCLRLSVQELQRFIGRYPSLVRRLNLYLYILLVQIKQSLACVSFHHIDARLARWLLMAHDRAHSDQFYLTHEFLADMLGVRRSGITVAAGALQAKKFISYTRGGISILDRSGLEQAACECYSDSREKYSALIN